ncbi:MAG: hypothetical protein NZ700_10195 [Gemmataceae bacterium]|nr:hypothetical protein [Gemmataceae bacterium]MDW8265499.1 hypothetical protein [Gemmataceae bacterium]
MRRFRLVLKIALAGTFLAALLAPWGLGWWRGGPTVLPRPLPHGHQELAWLQPATSTSTWERLMAGLQRLQHAWPELQVDDRGAFPEQTAAVPEVALWLGGSSEKLWIRWYKLTSEAGVGHWVRELARRDPSPLAIIGGSSSDRARDLAKALREPIAWQTGAPLLLLTTASADRVRLDDDQTLGLTPAPIDPTREPWHNLMDIYPGRTFRFCFTNSQMAEAVSDFLWGRPELRPHGCLSASLGAVGQAAGDAWGVAGWLVTGAHALIVSAQWLDDPYSIDLAERFMEVFARSERKPNSVLLSQLPYSVGGLLAPNPPEATEAQLVAANLQRLPLHRPLLVLPADVKTLRRFLRTLATIAPVEMRRSVAVTGDSLAFNVIYRDRDIAWNVLDLPMSLVFFCHADPVAWPNSQAPSPDASATDDELLNAELLRIVVEAAYEIPTAGQAPRLLGHPEELARRLHSRVPPFFQANGDRRGGSGEYVVWLQPEIEADRVVPRAVIEIWTRSLDGDGVPAWTRRRRLVAPTFVGAGEESGCCGFGRAFTIIQQIGQGFSREV